MSAMVPFSSVGNPAGSSDVVLWLLELLSKPENVKQYLESIVAEKNAALAAIDNAKAEAAASNAKAAEDAASSAEAVKAEALQAAQRTRDEAGVEIAKQREAAAETVRQASEKAAQLTRQAEADVITHSDRAAALTVEAARLDDVVKATNAQCNAVAARLTELRAEQARVEAVIADAKAKLGI